MLLWFMSENVLSLFFSRSFMVSQLIFNSLSNFEFSFLWGNFLNFIDLHTTVLLSQCHLPKRLYLLYIFASFIKHYVMLDVVAYFWTFYSVPVIHIFVFASSPCCFDYCSFAVWSSRKSFASSFFLFYQNCVHNSEYFMVPYKF